MRVWVTVTCGHNVSQSLCVMSLYSTEKMIFLLWCSVLCLLMIKSYYKVMRVLIQISVVMLSPLKEFHRQRLWSFTVYWKLSKDQKRQYCLELIPLTQWLPFCSELQHQTLQLIFSMAVKVNPCDTILSYWLTYCEDMQVVDRAEVKVGRSLEPFVNLCFPSWAQAKA